MKKKNRYWIYPFIALGLVLMLTNSCKKDDTNAATVTVTDVDGNEYSTVSIGTQTWMKENLKTTKYQDGTSISNITDNTTWAALTTEAYCWFGNNETMNKATYGALYNWYAVVDSRNLCPTGWHVPSDWEWTTLETYLGGSHVAGGKLKAITLWASPNTSGTNSSSFTALPGGSRNFSTGNFIDIGYYGFWWTSTEVDAACAWTRVIYYSDPDIYHAGSGDGYKRYGLSVRCIKD